MLQITINCISQLTVFQVSYKLKLQNKSGTFLGTQLRKFFLLLIFMATFESQFAAFSKYADTKSDGTSITLTQSDKWMKQAKIFDKKITTTDTAISFGKFKQKNLSLSDYNKFVRDLATSKGMNPKEIFDKMTSCGSPGSSNTTQAAGSSVVDRLTDTSKYTGAHKERFDDSGKDRGAEGRSDATTNEGYVQGYNKDTYDETHK